MTGLTGQGANALGECSPPQPSRQSARPLSGLMRHCTLRARGGREGATARRSCNAAALRSASRRCGDAAEQRRCGDAAEERRRRTARTRRRGRGSAHRRGSGGGTARCVKAGRLGRVHVSNAVQKGGEQWEHQMNGGRMRAVSGFGQSNSWDFCEPRRARGLRVKSFFLF